MARVPYIAADDLEAEYRDLVVSSLQPGKTANVYRAIANNPPVLSGLRTFLGALWSDSGLSDRERELVILAVARKLDSAYEWHQHVNIARSVGIPDEDVRAIASFELDGFEDGEAALVRYALAVVDGEVDDGLHDAVSATYGDEAVVGAAALSAGYAALAHVISSLDVEVEEEDEFVGWELADG